MIKEVKLSYGVGINDFEGQVNINGKKNKKLSSLEKYVSEMLQ